MEFVSNILNLPNPSCCNVMELSHLCNKCKAAAGIPLNQPPTPNYFGAQGGGAATFDEPDAHLPTFNVAGYGTPDPWPTESPMADVGDEVFSLPDAVVVNEKYDEDDILPTPGF